MTTPTIFRCRGLGESESLALTVQARTPEYAAARFAQPILESSAFSSFDVVVEAPDGEVSTWTVLPSGRTRRLRGTRSEGKGGPRS